MYYHRVGKSGIKIRSTIRYPNVLHGNRFNCGRGQLAGLSKSFIPLGISAMYCIYDAYIDVENFHFHL